MAATIHVIILIFTLLLMIRGGISVSFSINNHCDHTIWPGILSGAGTAPLSTTGFALSSGESRSISVPAAWSGRIWARTHCSSSTTGSFSCETGDCATNALECSGSGATPPATLAEFTLNGDSNLDFYDVSLVDGYNLPVLVVPTSTSSGNCTSTGCLMDLNQMCPNELKVMQDGKGVACKSACETFGSPEYCCSGEYGNPNTCKPSSYSQFFKNACPRAYSYAYDDSTSTFTCGGGGDYVITFCPSTTSQKSGQDTSNNTAVALPLVNDTMVYLGGNEVENTSYAVPSSVTPIVAAMVSWLLLVHLLIST